MTPDKIIDGLKERLQSTYNIRYEKKFEKFYEMFLNPKGLEPIRLHKILVILDRRPQSLISISYALYIAKVVNGELFALNQGLHASIISKEAQEVGIPCTVKIQENYTTKYITEYIKEIDPDLIIINFTHPLHEELQNTLRFAILSVKASQYVNI